MFGIKYFRAKCPLGVPRLALIYAVLKCEFSYRHISRTPNFRVKNMASRCDLYASIYGIEEFTSPERREQRDKILLQDYAATALHFISSNKFYFILMSRIIGSVGSVPQEIKLVWPYVKIIIFFKRTNVLKFILDEDIILPLQVSYFIFPRYLTFTMPAP